jgi:alpha-L-fucosidase
MKNLQLLVKSGDRAHFIFFILVLTLIFFCSGCGTYDHHTQKEYSWEEIAKVPVPDWFEDAKLGIFIHWGAYAVPGIALEGYAEWYPRFMYLGDETRKYHLETYGESVGYADFIEQFKAEKWDPDEWAELFDLAGAKYIAPVAEHHDGFAMWDSDLTHWDAKEKGPRRDIIGELGEAVRKRGLKYSPTYHRERHFWYFDSTVVAQEIQKFPERASLYGPFSLNKGFIDDYVARWKEIEEKYRPDFMWLDHIPYFEWEKKPYADMIPAYKDMFRNLVGSYLDRAEEWKKDIYFNNKGQEKWGINFPVGIREGDNLIMDDRTQKWQNPATIAHSYGYCQLEEEEVAYKSANTLIDLLIDIVSKNGNLLLNVGPRADGTISETQKKRLLEMGEWLRVNGEGIYGTRPWREFGEGPNKDQKDRYTVNAFTAQDFRFTQKDNTVYAFIMEWPEDRSVSLASFAGEKIVNVELLGHGPVVYTVAKNGLDVTLPDNKPCESAFTLKIKLK